MPQEPDLRHPSIRPSEPQIDEPQVYMPPFSEPPFSVSPSSEPQIYESKAEEKPILVELQGTKGDWKTRSWGRRKEGWQEAFAQGPGIPRKISWLKPIFVVLLLFSIGGGGLWLWTRYQAANSYHSPFVLNPSLDPVNKALRPQAKEEEVADQYRRLNQELGPVERGLREYFFKAIPGGKTFLVTFVEAKKINNPDRIGQDPRLAYDLNQAETFQAKDQIAYLRFCISKGDAKGARAWYDDFSAAFINEDGSIRKALDAYGQATQPSDDRSWPLALDLMGALAEADAVFSDPFYGKELQRWAEIWRPCFAADTLPMTGQIQAGRISHPLTSSEPQPSPLQMIPVSQPLNYLPLTDLDLLALHNLSRQDPAWQGIYDKYRDLVSQAFLKDPSFFAAGYLYPQTNIPQAQYLTVAGTAFAVETRTQAQLCWQIFQDRSSPEALISASQVLHYFSALVHQTGTLYEKYHMTMGTAMAEKEDFVAACYFRKAAYANNEVFACQDFDRFLTRFFRQEKLDPLRYTFATEGTKGGSRALASDQLEALLCAYPGP